MTTNDDDKLYVWPAVLDRYRDAYGGAPDLDDHTDRYLVMTLLEEAVHDRITRSLVVAFREATAAARVELQELRERQRHA